MNHKFILEPYKGKRTRYICPNCGSNQKTFTRYINAETGEHISADVGRCDREINCGYHYTPAQYFIDNGANSNYQFRPNNFEPRGLAISPDYIPDIIVQRSLQEYNIDVVARSNNLVKFLLNKFGTDATETLLKRYNIGTSKHWEGSTIFWQRDKDGNVRTGKVMLYNPYTGKRVKTPHNHISWVHTLMKLPEYNLQQCLFGEHLLPESYNPIGIVESEKTAVIASVYLPNITWLAMGGLGFVTSKLHVLQNRKVFLFPDLSKPGSVESAFNKWRHKALEISNIATCIVSDLLEKRASEEERKEGLDLADYLIRFDHKDFSKKDSGTIRPESEIIEEPVNLVLLKSPSPLNWNDEIQLLEKYFAGIELPTNPFKLNRFSTITDCSKFVESHLAALKIHSGKRTFLPYLDRLNELKNFLNAG